MSFRVLLMSDQETLITSWYYFELITYGFVFSHVCTRSQDTFHFTWIRSAFPSNVYFLLLLVTLIQDIRRDTPEGGIVFLRKWDVLSSGTSHKALSLIVAAAGHSWMSRHSDVTAGWSLSDFVQHILTSGRRIPLILPFTPHAVSSHTRSNPITCSEQQPV